MPVACPQRFIQFLTASAATLVLGCAASQPTASPAATADDPTARPQASLEPPEPPAEPKNAAVAALATQIQQFSETLDQSSQAGPDRQVLPPPEATDLPLPTEGAAVGAAVVSEVQPLGQAQSRTQFQSQPPAVAEPPQAVPAASVEGEWPASIPATPPAEAKPSPRLRDIVLDHLTAKPNSPAYAFDARLFELLTGETLPNAPTGGLLPEDERILDLLAKQCAEVRNGMKAGTIGDPAERVELILEMAKGLRREPGLTLPTVALCSEVRVFGDYDLMTPRFPVGQARPTVLYVEVDNFAARQAEGGWETKLTLSAILYGPDGHQVMSLPPFPVNDRSRQRRRDFFLAGRLTLPASVTPGRHMLKVTVKDELGQRVAQESVKIEFIEAR